MYNYTVMLYVKSFTLATHASMLLQMLYLLINTHVVLSAASFIEREGLGSAAQAFW